MRVTTTAWLAPLVLIACSPAWSAKPEEQYKNALTKAQAVTPLTEFGDQVSLRDGAVTFRNVDIEIPGIGPTIRIVRGTAIQDGLGSAATSGNRMAAWELEIPRIKTIVARGTNFGSTPMDATSPYGWEVDAPDKNARCSAFGAPGDVTHGATSVEFLASDWWLGYQLVDENGNEQKLMHRTAGMPDAKYRIGTSSQWAVSCLPSTKNGEPGEAFLAIAPDGTKYWFDYLVFTNYASLTTGFADMPPKGYTLYYTLQRQAASMLVTRIEDRFGNWLTYHYDAGRLTRIAAGDGRQVTLTHGASGVTAIQVGARTWTYGYSGEDLAQVTQPDGSAWRYAGQFGTKFTAQYHFSGCEQYNPSPPAGARQVSVTTPSGATATYTLEQMVFGRSHVLKNCGGMWLGGEGSHAANPKLYVGIALTRKSVSGPGLPTYVWRYSYSPHHGSYREECGSGCATRVWTDMVDPDQALTRTIFSNRHDQTENKLLREEFYGTAGDLLRAVDHVYATTPVSADNPFPWPLTIGWSFVYQGNHEASDRWTPLLARTITQQGTSYTLRHPAFDAWARPTVVERSNSLGTIRTESVAHYDNLASWVLGLVASTTCTAPAECAGTVIARTEFEPVSALPSKRWAFGALQETTTWHPDGTLASFRDANGNETRFDDYKLGIAQSIRFADGTQESAVVDDNGWITATVDAGGARTCYAYDAMGRARTITHPSEWQSGVCDDSSWTQTEIAFAAGHPAAYGVPAGHWRRTTHTGRGRQVTIYDALWRPIVEQSLDLDYVGETLREVVKRYDANGRLVFESHPMNTNGQANYFDASHKGTHTAYDALGRVIRVTQDSEIGSLTTRTEYLPRAQARVTNARGHATTTWYQTFDTPDMERPIRVDAPEGMRTDIVRDVFGKPTSITRSGPGA